MTKILVADDNQNIRELVVLLLQLNGFEVKSAVDGITAIATAHSEKPDLILLDIDMPGMSGLEVCRRLQKTEATHEIPIVFLTGNDDIQRGIVAGAKGYIIKPCSIDEIIDTIHLALG